MLLLLLGDDGYLASMSFTHALRFDIRIIPQFDMDDAAFIRGHGFETRRA